MAVARRVFSFSMDFSGHLWLADVVGQYGWCVVAIGPAHHSICPSVVSFKGAVLVLCFPAAGVSIVCVCDGLFVDL